MDEPSQERDRGKPRPHGMLTMNTCHSPNESKHLRSTSSPPTTIGEHEPWDVPVPPARSLLSSEE